MGQQDHVRSQFSCSRPPMAKACRLVWAVKQPESQGSATGHVARQRVWRQTLTSTRPGSTPTYVAGMLSVQCPPFPDIGQTAIRHMPDMHIADERLFAVGCEVDISLSTPAGFDALTSPYRIRIVRRQARRPIPCGACPREPRRADRRQSLGPALWWAG